MNIIFAETATCECRIYAKRNDLTLAECKLSKA